MKILVPIRTRSTLLVERIGEKSLGIPSPGTTGMGGEIFIPLTRSGYICIGSLYKEEKIISPVTRNIKTKVANKKSKNNLQKNFLIFEDVLSGFIFSGRVSAM